MAIWDEGRGATSYPNTIEDYRRLLTDFGVKELGFEADFAAIQAGSTIEYEGNPCDIVVCLGTHVEEGV